MKGSHFSPFQLLMQPMAVNDESLLRKDLQKLHSIFSVSGLFLADVLLSLPIFHIYLMIAMAKKNVI